MKKVNGQEQIQALVDKQKVIITEESIRRGLQFDDAEGNACLPNDTIFEELARMSAKTTAWNEFSSTMRQATKVHSPRSEILVEEIVPTPSNDLLPSGEDSIQLNELMVFYTNLQQQVLNLEEAKNTQAKEIAYLKKRVKKLEQRIKSRPAKLRRLKKVGSSRRVESSKEKDSLGAQEDASKQGRSNEVIVDVRGKIIEKEDSIADPVTTAGEVVTAANVEDNVALTTVTTVDVDDELTLAKTLIAIKAAKPKVISTAATTATTAITTPRAKGKEKMIEPKKPLKKKDQIALDEEVVRKLKAEMKAKMDEEERIAREKNEANRAIIKEWDDVHATIDANRQLSEQIQAQERERSYPLKKDLNFWLSLLNLEEIYKRVNTFVDMNTKNVEEILKKTQAEVQAEGADDDTTELKRCLEIVPKDDDDVEIEATPISSKSPTIVDYKIYREGKKSHFKVIRADGNLMVLYP
uniref:Xylulose kinase-1 n=1 Tax=Tanacetum cinerariifolium TaxID=118510 RepID=A0A699H928_TANCI|nr:hypothetical protein [Tanacetum cinerariifolium]